MGVDSHSAALPACGVCVLVIIFEYSTEGIGYFLSLGLGLEQHSHTGLTLSMC